MGCIKRFFKQLRCDHDWRKKGTSSEHRFGYFRQYRCPKCKKIKSEYS